VKQGDGEACHYERFTSGAARQGSSVAETKLRHLEQLVNELSQASHKASTPVCSQEPGVAEVPDERNASHDVPADQLVFRGATHWSAWSGLLAGIEQVRDALADQKLYTESGDMVNSTDIIFGAAPAMPYEQVLLQYLPCRQEVDRLTAPYFRSRAIRAPFLHTSHFARWYQKFWEAPHAASSLWASILFSICHVSENVLLPDSGPSLPTGRYAAAAAHCLIAGEYQRPRRFAVEALLLYLQVECVCCLDIPDDICTLFGLLIRLATKAGYHKEPGSGTFSPFEGEMRRRTWSLAMQLDLLLSFQAGMPSTVQFPTWDAQPPTNLQDSDFDEDTLVLPQARPATMDSDISFYISKHKLMVVFEKILRHALGPLDNDGKIVNALDNELRTTYTALPEMLRPKLMTESVFDPPADIVTRLCVFAIYAKSLCVLHRPYVTQGRPESVLTCYAASSDLLRYFCDAYTTFQPGGLNESERWFMGSITWNDFLLASMVLCLVLCVTSQKALGVDIDHEQTITLLRKANAACTEQATRSRDARRVMKLLEHVIARYGQFRAQTASPGLSREIVIPGLSASSSIPVTTMESDPMFTGDAAFDDAWLPNDGPSGLTHDPSWVYMEEFLQLPDYDFIPGS